MYGQGRCAQTTEKNGSKIPIGFSSRIQPIIATSPDVASSHMEAGCVAVTSLRGCCVVLGDQDDWGTNELSKAESILGAGMPQLYHEVEDMFVWVWRQSHQIEAVTDSLSGSCVAVML
ncbi:hypothetical protein TBH_C1050 [Thiolapillus brandeum]|uniref:Uncharacterized protein n=1 Tax=Thiolapillus brandeum TaxID=1076588 RepID=A0A7U6GI04_9GAMM|nr:hypothetical protein TBH_C1050 [Thiolapillus brandeum]